MPYFPSFEGTPAQWILVAFACCIPVFFLAEATGWMSFGYSKFAQRERRWSLPSRLGMFIIYFPAVFAYPLIFTYMEGPSSSWHTWCMALVVAHFAKRCLETLFLHKYSGVTNLGSTLLISSLYTLVALLLGYFAATDMKLSLLNSTVLKPLVVVGIVLWFVGTGINFYHHWLLARLRKPGETGYVLPTGGLFRWIACPHYFGEIVAWFGYAFLFHHIAAYIIAATMTAYLMGRSHNTVKWYRERLEGVPSNWKRLFPFVY